MLSYSPSSSTAWSSVYFIKQEMWMGWFIRGVHHFSAQALMVLLPLHLLQVVLARAYRRPREFVWWFGLALMFLAAAFSLTGYLLPWDQKGYWHARVATNIMGSAARCRPLYSQGADRGDRLWQSDGHPLLWPARRGVAGLVRAVHDSATSPCSGVTASLRRLGPRAGRRLRSGPSRPSGTRCSARVLLGVVITLTLIEGGTTLDAPADPSSADYPARPEWYFLSLFQMLKLFPGKREVIGTFVIPAVDRRLPWCSSRFWTGSCRPNWPISWHVPLCSRSSAGPAFSQSRPLRTDANDPLFQAARKKADLARERAIELAELAGRRYSSRWLVVYPAPRSLDSGPAGAGKEMPRLPLLRRQRLGRAADRLRPERFRLPRLDSRLAGKPEGTAAYFGKVPQCDGMAEWKKSSKLSPKQLDDVADFVASFAKIPADHDSR